MLQELGIPFIIFNFQYHNHSTMEERTASKCMSMFAEGYSKYGKDASNIYPLTQYNTHRVIKQVPVLCQGGHMVLYHDARDDKLGITIIISHYQMFSSC